jgi:hypothetical protein
MQKSGIRVRVIPVAENLLAERVTAAFAARSLADVIFHPIDFTVGWAKAGILDQHAATDPSQIYTQQVFEHIALSNNVQLTTNEGRLNLNTPEMIKTLEFYKALAGFSPPGNLYWLHTRLDYLTRRAAMIV